MERLENMNPKDETFDKEIKRADAVSKLAQDVIKNNENKVKLTEVKFKYSPMNNPRFKLLNSDKEDDENGE